MSPTILNTKKKVHNTSWTLQWSPVYSEGQLVTLYTVWHTKDTTTREKSWFRENVTGLEYRRELTADTSYLFAVTAWNRWGESSLERGKMLYISTDFPASIKQKTDKTIFFTHTGKDSWPLIWFTDLGQQSLMDYLFRVKSAYEVTPVSVAWSD